MVEVRRKPVVQPEPILIRAGRYLLLAYWMVCISLYFTVDLFIDLYTTTDFAAAFWYAVIIALPFAVLTICYTRTLLTKWYTYILYPVVTFGLYIGCTYFNVLNADLLLSVALKPNTEQTIPVEHVQQVIARKIIYTQ